MRNTPDRRDRVSKRIFKNSFDQSGIKRIGVETAKLLMFSEQLLQFFIACFRYS